VVAVGGGTSVEVGPAPPAGSGASRTLVSLCAPPVNQPEVVPVVAPLGRVRRT
jgi:hypothetical protein